MPEKNLKLNPPAGGQNAKIKQPLAKSQGRTEAKIVAKKAVVKRPKASGLTVPVYSLEGRGAGVLTLSKDLFGAAANKKLLAQAVRVYLNNQKGHFGSSKTRSEVAGSTRKIRAQKGTGGARHGSIRAPIFVGGGVALGPKYRKVVLDLPKKMKRVALLSALSLKLKEGEVIGTSGLEKASGKTAQIKKFLDRVGKKNALFVLGEKRENVSRAVRNLGGVQALISEQINTLEVMKYKTLILTKEAVEKLESRIKSNKAIESKEVETDNSVRKGGKR